MNKTKLTAAIMTAALIMTLLAAMPTHAVASEPIKVTVNGQNVNFPDVQPYIDSNGRTMVPVRFVTEALGCDVKWDGETRTVTIDRGTIYAELTIGKNEIILLDISREMDTSAVLRNGRTFVPARFVAEAFGCDVKWDGSTRTVIINDSGKDVYKVGDIAIPINPGDRVNRTTSGSLSVIKESGLIIIGGSSSDSPMLMIYIKVDMEDKDIPKQRQETEDLLKQIASEETVKEIMEYSQLKTNRFEDLEMRKWYEGNCKIIMSGDVGPIVLTLFLNYRG